MKTNSMIFEKKFIDDSAAIAFALSMASLYIDEDVNEKARKKLIELMAQVVC